MKKNRNLLQTPYGTLSLAKKDAQRLKKTVMQLHRTTDSLTRKDIGDWRAAWQLAINIDNPNRQRLYDIYRDVEVDLHLSGCIQQREGFVLARSFKIVRQDGETDEEATKCFNAPWFKQLMKHALDANYWGHSLIEHRPSRKRTLSLSGTHSPRYSVCQCVLQEPHHETTRNSQRWNG